MQKVLRIFIVSLLWLAAWGCSHVQPYEEASNVGGSTCTPPPYYFARHQVEERVFFQMPLPPTAAVLDCAAAPRANYVFQYEQYDFLEACSLKIDPSEFPLLLRASNFTADAVARIPPLVEQLSSSLPDKLLWSYKPAANLLPTVYSDASHTHAILIYVNHRCTSIGH
jgi:hypothetical protein